MPLVLGLAFHAQIDALLDWLSAVGGRALLAAVVLVALYSGYRWLVRRHYLRTVRAARIGVADELVIVLRDIGIDVHARSCTVHEILALLAGEPEAAADYVEANEKVYRLATAYDIPDEVGQM